MSEHWPSRYEPPAPALPRVEDLPTTSDGYDREKVREAFDAFYRHAAQLDAALRTLEAVEAFQRSAAELRGDLRAIRAAGFTAQTWQRSYGREPRVRRPLLPEAFPRVAAEVVFLIAVAVALGVSGWGALPVVGVMALALVLVWAVEWLTSRERPVRPPVRRPATTASPAPAEVPAESEPMAAGWAAFAEGEEDHADAMTMVEPLPSAEPVAALEAPEAEAEAEGEAEAEAEVSEPSAKPVVVLEPEAVVVDEEPETAGNAPEAVEPVLEESEEPAAELEPDREPEEEEVAAPVEAEPELRAVEGAAAAGSVVEEDEAAEPGAPLPAPAEEEPPLTEVEVVEEPLIESTASEEEPEAAEDSLEEVAPEPRRSIWQRLRGGPADSEVIVEPPSGDAAATSEAAVATEAADEPQPELVVDELGVVSGHDEAEDEALVDELGVIEHAEESEAEPTETVAEQPRRRFWHRRSEPEAAAPAALEAAEETEDPTELSEEAAEIAGEAELDPWEQGLQFPAEPEGPADLKAVEADDEVVFEEPVEQEDEEEELFVAAVQEDDQTIPPADEALARDRADEEDELVMVSGDDGAVDTAESGSDSEPDLAPMEPSELPIEVLAEQAAAALERSRARRRQLRRSRRR